MRKKSYYLFLVFFIISSYAKAQEKNDEKSSPAIDEKPLHLLRVASEPKNRSSDVIMKLRFKMYDEIFERLTFYDNKNIDIEFDVSSKESKKNHSDKIGFLCEGAEYMVVFSVKEYAPGGKIYGVLKEFRPAVIEKLP